MRIRRQQVTLLWQCWLDSCLTDLTLQYLLNSAAKSMRMFVSMILWRILCWHSQAGSTIPITCCDAIVCNSKCGHNCCSLTPLRFTEKSHLRWVVLNESHFLTVNDVPKTHEKPMNTLTSFYVWHFFSCPKTSSRLSSPCSVEMPVLDASGGRWQHAKAHWCHQDTVVAKLVQVDLFPLNAHHPGSQEVL